MRQFKTYEEGFRSFNTNFGEFVGVFGTLTGSWCRDQYFALRCGYKKSIDISYKFHNWNQRDIVCVLDVSGENKLIGISNFENYMERIRNPS